MAPKRVPQEDIIKSFLEEKVLFSNLKEVPTRSHDLWSKLSKKIQEIYPATPFTIYTWFVHNRYELRDLFIEKLQNADVASPHTDYSHSDDSNTEDSSENESDSGCDVIKFTVSISQTDWSKMVPEWVHHRDSDRNFRRRLVLKRKNWTHIISDKFYKHTKLPCCLKFINNKVTMNDDSKYYVRFKAKCKFCHSQLRGNIPDKPDLTEDIVMHIRYAGSFTKRHPLQKRQISGDLRKEVVTKLKTDSATYLQKEMARTAVSFEDKPSPNIPNLSTLRVAKSESGTKIRYDPDPIVSLHKAKYSGEYVNIIQDIGLDKFFVHYYSSQQIHIYNDYVKCLGVKSQISIDATGGVVRGIKRPNNEKSKTILLYDITIHDRPNNKILSVANMLSERHDTVSITHFLHTWRRSGAMVPKSVVCDMSLALMSACVQSFSEFSSLNEYLSHCSLIIQPDSTFKVPNFYLKNDIAHMVKLVTQFPSLRTVIKRTKAFYIRIICLIIQETRLQRMEEIIKKMFQVALHETEGQFPDGRVLPSEEAKNFLKELISSELHPTYLSEISETENIEGETESYEDQEEIETLEHLDEEITPGVRMGFKQWTENIKQLVLTEKNDQGDRNNQQFCPGLVKDFIKISNLLPTWSSVMVPYFKYGNRTSTSCAVETQFRILKNNIFSSVELPARIDDFVLKHVNYINGAMKMDFNDSTFSTLLNCSNSSHDSKLFMSSMNLDLTAKDINLEILSNSTLLDENLNKEMSLEENWRGINDGPLEKRPRSSYLEPNSEWRTIDLSKTTKVTPLGLLKNGNTFSLKPIKLSDGNYILKNTCAFDSIVQITCTAVCDSDLYKSCLLNVKCANILSLGEILEDLLKVSVSAQTYRKRASFLKKILPKDEVRSGLFEIDSSDSLSPLVKEIFKSMPSMNSIGTCSNETCKEVIDQAIVSKDIFCDGNFEMSVDILEQKIKECLIGHPTICPCGGTKTYQNFMNNHLFVSIFTKNKCINHKLCNIPKSIIFGEKVLNLRGCIGYRGAYSTMGHFETFSLRENNQWENYDDLKACPRNISGNTEILLELIFYTV